MPASESTVCLTTSYPTPLGRLLMAGQHRDITPPPMAWRVWDIYSLVYVLEGKGRHLDVDHRDIPLRAGDLIFMFPAHGYRYLADPGQPWSEFYLQFQGAIFDLWRREGVLTPNLSVVHLEPVEYWHRRLCDVVSMNGADNAAQTLTRIVALQALLAEIINIAQQPNAEDRQWLTHAQRLLDTLPLTGEERWAEVAEAVCLSSDRFRRKFQQLAGISPTRYLARRRCEEACRLLRDSGIPLRTIAQHLGYYDEFHFSRRFKQLMGLSPSHYRRVCSYKVDD